MAKAAKADAAAAAAPEGAEGEGGAKKGGKGKLLLLAAPVVLAALGAGLWFTGILPGLLGMNKPPEVAADGAPPGPRAPVFFEMPEITANLNAPGRRSSFLRLRSKLELSRPEDTEAVQKAMPRLLDAFQVYLREIRPEELRGSAGTQRLREELMVRATHAAHPARVTDVLFTEILVQ